MLGTSAAAFELALHTVPAYAVSAVTYARCFDQFDRSPPARAVLSRCLGPVEHTRTAWMLTGVGLLIAVAALLYWSAPGWIRWRGRRTVVAAARLPELHAQLARLAGPHPAPTFLIDLSRPGPGALAYGRRGRYVVRLNAGLVPLARRDPAMFAAIVRHELAHLRRSDVDIAYAVVAIWRAFVVTALIPLAATATYQVVRLLIRHATVPASVYPTAARMASFILVAYLCRNGVLRAREAYADAHAADGTDGLRRAIALTRPVPRWRRLFSVHPDPAARRRALDDPVLLRRPGLGEHFVAGLTAALAAETLLSLAIAVFPNDTTIWYRPAAWPVALLVAGILGSAAWRAKATGVSVLPAAAALGLGWSVAEFAAFTSQFWTWGVVTHSTDTPLTVGDAVPAGDYGPATAVCGGLLLIAGLLTQAGISAAGARTGAGGPAMWRSWWAGVVVTSVPFAVWYAVWSQISVTSSLVDHVYSLGVDDPARLGVDVWRGPGFALLTLFYPPLLLIKANPLAVPALILAWAYPLLAAGGDPLLTARGRSQRDAGDRPLPATGRSAAGSPRQRAARWRDIGGAARMALVAGVGFAVVLVVARALVHGLAPERAASAGFAGYFYYSAVTAVTVLAFVVGGLVAARYRERGLALGQLAATTIAVLGTVAFVGASAIGGCVPAVRLRVQTCAFPTDLSYAWNLLRTLALQGAAAALIGGVLIQVSIVVARRLTAARPMRLAVAGGAAALLLLAGSGVGWAAYGSGAAPARTTLGVDDLQRAADAVTIGLPAAWVRQPLTTPSPGPSTGSPASAGPSTSIRPSAPTGPSASARPSISAEPSAPTGPSTSAGPSASAGPSTSAGARAVIDPAGCRPLLDSAYLSALKPEATANAGATARGRVSSASISAQVTSYPEPITAAVLTAAERDRLACPRYTATAADGFRVAYAVRDVPAAALGDQSWRMTYDMSLAGSRVAGTEATAVVRSGHTLVVVTMIVAGTPFDEALFQAAVARVVGALPG